MFLAENEGHFVQDSQSEQYISCVKFLNYTNEFIYFLQKYNFWQNTTVNRSKTKMGRFGGRPSSWWAARSPGPLPPSLWIRPCKSLSHSRNSSSTPRRYSINAVCDSKTFATAPAKFAHTFQNMRKTRRNNSECKHFRKLLRAI